MKTPIIPLISLLGVMISSQALADESLGKPFKGRIESLLVRPTGDFIGLTAYEQNYLMETYSNGNYYDAKDMKHDEVKFQISVALPIWRDIFGEKSVLAGSYTQRSWFQLSNVSQSSPFRETNYEPSLFLGWSTQKALPWGWTLQDWETGFVHESNGRSDYEMKSRSWNRLYARASATKDNWIIEIKPWWRIPEKADKDDNPDISKYRGYFDLSLGYRSDSGHQIKVKGHYSLKNRGGVEVSYSYPLTEHISLYTQYYGGYGESLLDHNRKIQRIGVGISLNNVF